MYNSHNLFSLKPGITRPLPIRERLSKDEDSLKGELTNLPSHGDQRRISVYSVAIHIRTNKSSKFTDFAVGGLPCFHG